MNAKTVFVTGGTGSIGSELVEGLSASGYNVYFTSRSQEKIAQLERSPGNERKGFVQGLKIDFDGNYLSCLRHFFQDADRPRPHILVNNVRNVDNLVVDGDGITTEKHFSAEMHLGVVVPYHLSLFFARLAEGELENVINISSMYGIVPPNGSLYPDGYSSSPVQYGVAKAALIHLTKELAVRLAASGIRVNCISFGGVEGRVDDDFKLRYGRLTPTRRMLDRTEVTGPVLFLASEASKSMTGHNLVCDGGYTIW